MFQKESLIKRYLFLLLDMICIIIAILLANLFRFRRIDLTEFDYLYVKVAVVAMVACFMGVRAFHLDKHVFDRGWYQEFLAITKAAICIGILVMAFLYFSQEAINFSRLLMIYMIPTYIILDYIAHVVAKPIVAKYYRGSHSYKQIMLITSSDKVDEILHIFESTNNWYFRIAYLVFVDRDRKGDVVNGIPVIANLGDALEVTKTLPLDGVFINTSYQSHAIFDVRKVLHDFQSMGVTVHVNIDALELDVTDKRIENLGFFKVVSYASKIYEPGQLVLKKIMDLVGGLVGALITILVGIFVVPAIKLDSPGPAIYTQYRVGRNGRHFKMYKFRSMYIDADARKAELEAQNEMQGAMFKMKDDPRITKVGKFIRKYSIDELPQFFNVLKGDMSLVGTRPPTVEEVEKYKVEQKRRLSVTPGMTGLWQTSGRSDIYDFDQIVKLDLDYIDHWSIGLDIKLLIKTIIVCFKGKGAE